MVTAEGSFAVQYKQPANLLCISSRLPPWSANWAVYASQRSCNWCFMEKKGCKRHSNFKARHSKSPVLKNYERLQPWRLLMNEIYFSTSESVFSKVFFLLPTSLVLVISLWPVGVFLIPFFEFHSLINSSGCDTLGFSGLLLVNFLFKWSFIVYMPVVHSPPKNEKLKKVVF